MTMEMSGKFVELFLMSRVPVTLPGATGVQVNPTVKNLSYGMVAGVAGLTPGCRLMAGSPV